MNSGHCRLIEATGSNIAAWNPNEFANTSQTPLDRTKHQKNHAKINARNRNNPRWNLQDTHRSDAPVQNPSSIERIGGRNPTPQTLPSVTYRTKERGQSWYRSRDPVERRADPGPNRWARNAITSRRPSWRGEWRCPSEQRERERESRVGVPEWDEADGCRGGRGGGDGVVTGGGDQEATWWRWPWSSALEMWSEDESGGVEREDESEGQREDEMRSEDERSGREVLNITLKLINFSGPLDFTCDAGWQTRGRE
jgi:hypothetical protein